MPLDFHMHTNWLFMHIIVGVMTRKCHVHIVIWLPVFSNCLSTLSTWLSTFCDVICTDMEHGTYTQ